MAFFKKIAEGLKKTREGMVAQIDSFLNSFTTIDDEFFEELEELLVLSDIGMSTATEICDKLKIEIKKTGAKTPEDIKAILRRLIAEILQGDEKLKLDAKPSIILVIGVNGVGKTTTIGKLSAQLKNEGKRVLISAADTFRAGAIEQLQIWADRSQADIVRQEEGSDPAAVVFDSISAAKKRGIDVIICDTAGRLHNKKHLMEELSKINRIIDRELPNTDKEVLLVLDATTGQNAVNQAREFKNATGITGIVLTKLDGTAKGGVILAIKSELDVPIKYIGVGEQIEDLQPFNAQDFAEALFPSEQQQEDKEPEKTSVEAEEKMTILAFVIATNNPKKLEELKRILEPLDIGVFSASDMGIDLDEVEETGMTFEENAAIKARAAYKFSGLPVIADDSGLSVDALNGAPGVFSARYAGEGASDKDKIDKLLDDLKDVEPGERKAHFTTAICCILPNGEEIYARGECHGQIALEPKGENGFGYDPIFITEDGRSFAQRDEAEKDKISHRGNALRAFNKKLHERLGK